MSKLRVRNLFKNKFARAKSTTDLAEWSKSDDKLLKAVGNGDVKKVASLLSKKSLVPTKVGRDGRSVFHIACALGNEPIVDMLIKETEDVNDLTIQGNTALQLAAAKGHTHTVEMLLKAAANVDLRDSNDMTALHHACAGLHLECVKALLLGNANPHVTEKGGKTPLFYSAHRGDVEICKWLLDKGARINCQDMLSVTPLMIASKEGHRNVCEFFIKRGANPNMADREGHTAMNYAIAAGHTELQEVFDSAPISAFYNKVTESDLGPENTHSEELAVAQSEEIATPYTSDPVEEFKVEAAAGSDDENTSHVDAQSIHSMDDALLPNRAQSPTVAKPNQLAKTEQAYRELQEEHEQLNEEYSSLSIENLKLRDKLESLQSKFNEKHQQDTEMIPKEVEDEIRTLKDMLEDEKEKVKNFQKLESTRDKQILADDVDQVPNKKELKSNGDGWSDSGGEESSGQGNHGDSVSGEESQQMKMLKSQILALRLENEKLKATETLPNGDLGSPEVRKSPPADGQEEIPSLQQLHAVQMERDQLNALLNQMKEESEKQQLGRAVDQEELLQSKSSMEAEVAKLREKVVSLEVALEGAKNEVPTDAQRLDALLEQSRNFEDVAFDDDGFVMGRDMTKEEFLQSQNQQLRTHCGLLSEELEKLRATFDAILKAGDNLQADYDQQAAEKDALQDDLEVALKEKMEVMNENEFLLTDNNALHDDLKKLVHELEKMQEKLQTAQAENEELKRSVSVASKVGEVSRLLEERDTLQQRCLHLEATLQKLQHDHDILMEEVQSLSESVDHLTGERDQLTSDLEEMESVCQQNETLQQDYTQLELDFGEILKEKEALEQGLCSVETKTSAAVSLDGVTTTVSIDGTEASTSDGNAILQQAYDDAVTEKLLLQTKLEDLQQEKAVVEDRVKLLEEQQPSTVTPHSHGTINNNNNDRSEEESDKKTEELLRCQQEIVSLRKQIARLKTDVAEWEQKHADTISTYRTHLLSAVQGHMDPDVKDALYHIIELRSMEQFC